MAGSYGLVGIACFILVVAAGATASATQFRVGGGRGWSVPDAGAEPYNSWAGRMRFQIGDQLLFVYPKGADAVLVVEPGAYGECNTSSYVSRFDDGSTVVTLDRSGPFFFISGSEANCRANEKLIVVVMADRTGRATPPSSASMPSPSTSPPSPAPAATPGSAPAPAALAPSPSTSPPTPAPAATPGSAPAPAALAPSPSTSSPPSISPMPAPAATPGSAPSPTTATPSSPPSPVALVPSPSSSPTTPGGVPQPPPASANPPGSEGTNTTPPSPPFASGQRSGVAPVVAGLVTSLGACIGYAMLAV